MTILCIRPNTFILAGLFSLALLSMGCGASGRTTSAGETEEVAVGYGTQERSTVTSAVSHVDPDEQRRPVTRVEEMLEKVPGVRLMRSEGGGIRVLIRGASSVNGSNDPLYVVDGMTIEVDPDQGLYWLNPNDVASIDVLRDAGATAIYGSRGAGGVIIIKTRRQ